MMPEGIESMTISLDGKTIRFTEKMDSYESLLHIVSAQVSELGMTFAQKSVEGKSNEIPAVQELLEELDISGCIIVAGALKCQKKTATSAISGGADNVLSVKDNQSSLIDCSLPGEKGKACVDLFFDLEMQRESEPGYPIPKRRVYYCCRLISRQIETLGKEAYNQLRPIYSVWILVNNIPEDLKNSVYTAGMTGGFGDDKKDMLEDTVKIGRQIDLIHLCLIYLSEDFKVEEGQSDLIKYLQAVFTRKIDDKSCNPYCEYSSGIKKEVDEMMSLREAFELRGERRGERRGEQRGEQRGIAEVIKLLFGLGKKDKDVVQYLMTGLDNPLTEEQALNALKSYYEKNS